MALRDLQIDWLKCFVAVVDTGSISNAGAEVNRSQSAISMQLKKLEQAIGRTLIIRSPHRLELTSDGQMLLGYARQMLALHAETQAAFNEQLTGRIRLGVAEDYVAKYLTPALRRFIPRHTGVEIELQCEQSNVLIPRVESGELDLALVSRDQKKRGVTLFREPMVWAGSAKFELWSSDPLPVAFYDETSLARTLAINSLAHQGRRYKVVYQSSSLAGQIAAVESGLAIAALTKSCVPDSLQILGIEHHLSPIESVDVVLYRSQSSKGQLAVDRLNRFLTNLLRREHDRL
ncbi:LysR family transcriptional regulator [Maribrevibacterium harenarium]|uniref:LysR family transcriptional regulator n=1 Tax=Maribrevibacterium harenarium TaxID=2589817 RepID=A0A501WMB2_9GAMM|nr:LysR substrate-binding domain-containing protein [Maribrevibacterium harenarium]TPE49480.1 LysR family transcriptional regulator [Maribrevibacterium harenarium]